ncbi:MAG TPA: ATP-binding protein, partial [Alphaproteobacteria bacterium]|nr:ATP-binding protein [Alphaproteobacteria bacterium]
LTELINSGSISDPRRLSFTAPDDPIWLTCAPSDLEIVLSNLVDNAVKYAGEKAEIAVTLARQDDHFVLTVEDDGPGIPAGKREEVFNRFVRLASSSTYGSGLGLALVKEIVTRLGGEVKLGSSKRLNGLIVTARLPAEAEADASSDGPLRAAG